MVYLKRKGRPDPDENIDLWVAFPAPYGGWNVRKNDGRVPGSVVLLSSASVAEHFEITQRARARQ